VIHLPPSAERHLLLGKAYPGDAVQSGGEQQHRQHPQTAAADNQPAQTSHGLTTGLSYILGREFSMRTVNVHEAKTHFSRLIDAAHAGETILVAKDGKPWARLVPLDNDRPRRQPGLLRGQLQLPSMDVLLAPLPPEELDAIDAPLPS
jgi:prevent-host-death family protein